MTNMYIAICEPNVHYLKVECEFYSSRRHSYPQRMECGQRSLYRLISLRPDILHPRRSPLLQRRLRNSRPQIHRIVERRKGT